MAGNKILYAERDNTCFIKMTGSIRYTLSAGLDLLIDRLEKENTCQDVLIDLIDAANIDSTNLGLLARVARMLIGARDKKPTIVSTNVSINRLLHTMGFEQAFILIDHCAAADPLALREISDMKTCKAKAVRTILESHRILMEMNEKNKTVFQNVVDMLEKDLGEEKS